MVRRLTSPSNGLLKAVRRAIMRGTATPDGFLVAETFHLLEEALRSECRIGAVLAAESVLGKVEDMLRGRPGVPLAAIPDALSERLSATEASQGVLTLVRPPAWSLEDLFAAPPLVVALDGVQDPGNMGSILRAAEAFGSTGVALLRGCANPHNPKVIRASAGSVFRCRMAAGLEPKAFMEAALRRDLVLYAAQPAGGVEAFRADFRRGCAIVIGGEGQGLPGARWAGAAAVRIPTASVESLNAAMAAGILLYEARRQRGHL